MEFRYWYEGFLFVLMYTFLVRVSCFFVAFLGAKMINELGNFPTKTAGIQVAILWKLFIVEAVSFLLFVAFFRIFS